MKRRFSQYISSLAVIALMGGATMLCGCSDSQVDDFFKKFIKAPASTIERDVKGHDQIYAVHAILRMGYRGGTIDVGRNGDEALTVYNTYQMVGDSLSIPVMQEIDISKDDEGQMTVTTTRDHFDVVASDSLCYGLELKYYDQNGMLINHQFSSYFYKEDKNGNMVPDDVSSALQMHQHFFSIGHSSLNQNAPGTNGTTITQTGLQLAYPRTLEDRPRYLDRYTFREKSGKPVRATKFSASNIYAPLNLEIGNNAVNYNADLAWKAIATTGKPEALQPYTDEQGNTSVLYQTIEGTRLNALAPEIFTYEYRDTDPVEEEVGKLFVESYNDDFIDPDTKLPRQRYSHTVGLIRQQRSLDTGVPFDRLGFKGILRFRQKDLAFQLQVRICNILNKGYQQAGGSTDKDLKPAKYTNVENMNNGYVWEFNQIQPGWDNYDIDYPLPVRIIADTREGKKQCCKDVQRFYPKANAEKLWRMLSNPRQFFSGSQYRQNVVLM